MKGNMDMGTWSSGRYLLSVDVQMTLDSLNLNTLQVDCGPSRGRKQIAGLQQIRGKMAGAHPLDAADFRNWADFVKSMAFKKGAKKPLGVVKRQNQLACDAEFNRVPGGGLN